MSIFYTETEEKLSNLWKELDVANKDRNNNFFASGGDSLLLIRLSMLIKEKLDIDVGISELLQSPVLADMATYIDSQRQSAIPACRKRSPEKGLVIPLSSSQRGIWFQSQLDTSKDGKDFTIPLAFHIHGAVDPERFEYAINAITRRHQILNATFYADDSEPAINLHGSGISFNYADIQQLSAAEQQHKLKEIQATEAARHLDISRGPLVYISLVKAAADTCYLFITSHHMLFDGLSYDIFLNELVEFYAGKAPAELNIDYIDFALWENSEAYQNYLAAGLEYWQTRLANFAPTELPAKNGGVAFDEETTSLFCSLSAERVKQLHTLAQQHSTTLYTVFSLALQVALNELKTGGDVAFGTYVSNRILPEFNKVIGNFVNPLLLRFDFDGGQSISAALTRTHNEITQDFSWQNVPFESIVHRVNPERRAGEHAFFEFTFVYNDAVLHPQYVNEHFTVKPWDNGFYGLDTNRTDIELWVRPDANGLQCELNINRDKINARLARVLLDGFENTLTGFVQHPASTPLHDLPFLPQGYEYSVLEGDTVPFENKPISELIRLNANRDPHKIIICDDRAEYPWHYLEDRSNDIAARLNTLGVAPGDIVGVMLPHSVELAVSALSVLKCGGIILLLDTTDSPERLQTIVDSAGCRLVITRKTLSAAKPGGIPHLLIDELSPDLAAEPLPIRETPRTYMIYTSGSTGRAKALFAKRYGLLNRVYWLNHLYPFSANDTCILKTSVSFVDFYAELFLPLILDQKLYIASDDIRKNPEDLAAAIADNHITHITLTPTVLREICRSLQEKNILISTLKTIISSGEMLSRDVVAKVKQYVPGTRLLNIYGSSEMSADVTCHEVQQHQSGDVIPAGKLVYNSKAKIVNKNGLPVAKGLTGELWVSGDILADGYVEPGMGQENAFFSAQGEPWFKTGDYACLNADNELVIVGRKDDRQKIRGIAVDLKEIDRALLSCRGVRLSCTVVMSLANGEQILASLLETEQGCNEEDIYSQLEHKLPRSLLPGLLKTTGKLPTLSGGKIDKQRTISLLNAALSAESSASETFAQGPLEVDLENIWQQLLNTTQRIGVQQNFFRLGGHSLLASRLLGKIRTHFAIDITLSDIFNAPTIAGLARLVAQSERHQVDIVPAVSADNLYELSFNQQRLLYLQNREPQSISYNMTFSITLAGKIDLAKLTFSLNEIIKRHDVLRSSFTEFIDEKGLAAFNVRVNELGYVFPSYKTVAPEAFARSVEEELAAQHHTPFDLSQSPLLRVSVIDAKCDKCAIVICFHHIISDGWSVAILFKELSALYNDQPLPVLPFRHVDYTHWVRGWIADEKRHHSLTRFWQHYLADVNSLQLVTDTDNDFTTARKSKVINQQYLINLNSVIENNFKERHIDPYDLVLTAFACVLSTWKQVNNYLIGTVSAGRHLHSGCEDIFGFLANTLPVKIDLDAQSSLTDILFNTVAARREVLKYQDLPFDAIVNSLGAKASSGSLSSLIQVMCAHQNIDYRSVSFANAETHIDAWLGESEAKFELVLQTAQLDNDTLNISVEYSEASFQAFEIHKLLDAFVSLLRQLVKPQRQTLAELDLFHKKPAYQHSGDVDIPADFPKTLPEFIKKTAQNYPTHGITLIEDGEKTVLSYKDLYEKSVQCARKLNNLGLQKGDIVVLIPDRLDEFFCLFWGAILARVIPVTVARPLDFSQDDSCYKLIDACKLFNYAPIVTNGELVDEIALLRSRHGEIQYFNTRLAAVSRDFTFVQPQPQPQDTAFYQLTSGSTGKSKAISERHEALAAYVYLSSHSRDYNPTNCLLNWLPMDHIGPLWLYHVRAVCVGSNQIHVSTPLILEKPMLWLELITEFKVSHSWAPNFAYKLVINEKNKLARDNPLVDLSSLKELVTGGEMVTGNTVRAFNQLLKPFGLGDGVLTPSFGMAESCTCITYARADDPEIPVSYLKFSDQDKLQAGSSSFTSLGKVIAGVEIRIADDHNRTLEEYHVGHYQIRGPNVTNGYYQQQALNESVFSEDGWFDSGDNGFIAEGNLYLVGRTKEMLIVNGKNYFCHEIEEQLEQIEGILSTYIAAFSVKTAEQEDVVICYVPADPSATDRINQEISALLYRSIGLYVNRIIPVAKALFLKTTSGKIQRAKMAKKFVDGKLLSLAQYRETRLNVRSLTWETVTGVGQLPAGEWLSVGDVPPGAESGRNVSLAVLASALADSAVSGVLFGKAIYENTPDLLALIQQISSVKREMLAQMTVCCLVDGSSEKAGLVHGLFTALLAESSLRRAVVVQTTSALPVLYPENMAAGWYRQESRGQLEKLTPAAGDFAHDWEPDASDDADGYAVITGAGGAIAKLLVNDLTGRFAKLILLGRGDEPEYVQRDRERLHWIKTDFSDLKQLLVACRGLGLAKPPAFIYHLAGIASQARLQQITPDSLADARQPKTQAIEHLRKVMSILYPTACKRIHFVLFGSVVTFRASLMLGNYIAANAELLGYAQARRNDGYPVSWLGWSAWQNTGMGQGQDAALLREMGLQVVDAAQGIRLLNTLRAHNGDLLIGSHSAGEPMTNVQAAEPANRDEQRIEAALLALIKALLSVDSVGLNDNFFELGLSSIDLTRLHRSINNRLAIDINLVDILQFSTISKLSTYILQNKLADGNTLTA